MKPKLFIASAKESVTLAHAIQKNLHDDAEVTVWDQMSSQLSISTLESILSELQCQDFGVFVFSPDDNITIRAKNYRSARDNVIFEAGLFAGRLGRERCFIVLPEDVKSLRLPSDLLGLITARFNLEWAKDNPQAALGPACLDIRNQIKRMGKYVPQEAYPLDKTGVSLKPSLIQSSKIEGLWLSRFEYKTSRDKELVRVQYDIEYLKATSHYTLYGENIVCAGSSGRHKYLHELRVSLYKNSLVGDWINTNTENAGCFQLHIYTNCNVMSGQHLGNSDDNSIQEGAWDWIKIDYPAQPSTDKLHKIKKTALKSIEDLDIYFRQWVDNAEPIKLAEIQD